MSKEDDLIEAMQAVHAMKYDSCPDMIMIPEKEFKIFLIEHGYTKEEAQFFFDSMPEGDE